MGLSRSFQTGLHKSGASDLLLSEHTPLSVTPRVIDGPSNVLDLRRSTRYFPFKGRRPLIYREINEIMSYLSETYQSDLILLSRFGK